MKYPGCVGIRNRPCGRSGSRVGWNVKEEKMGTFQIKVTVHHRDDPDRKFEEQFWVDTGALYTFIPEDRLHQIGAKPMFTQEFILADGRQMTQPVGEVVLKAEGIEREMTCPAVFAPKGSLFLLGATALENFGVDVDPVNRRLKPIVAIVGGHFTGRAAKG